jgi:hypothetical protein
VSGFFGPNTPFGRSGFFPHVTVAAGFQYIITAGTDVPDGLIGWDNDIFFFGSSVPNAPLYPATGGTLQIVSTWIDGNGTGAFVIRTLSNFAVNPAVAWFRFIRIFFNNAQVAVEQASDAVFDQPDPQHYRVTWHAGIFTPNLFVDGNSYTIQLIA